MCPQQNQATNIYTYKLDELQLSAVRKCTNSNMYVIRDQR